jgi:hypothetical protein
VAQALLRQVLLPQQREWLRLAQVLLRPEPE